MVMITIGIKYESYAPKQGWPEHLQIKTKVDVTLMLPKIHSAIRDMRPVPRITCVFLVSLLHLSGFTP